MKRKIHLSNIYSKLNIFKIEKIAKNTIENIFI